MNNGSCLSEIADKTESPLPIRIAESDWVAYQRWRAREEPDSMLAFKSYGTETAYVRACALAYLGRRAQLHDGVCSRTQPRVLTSTFMSKLEGANRTERFRRYPWLETLLNLLAEIDRIHEEVAFTGNVISLVPVAKPV
jgi:hypothetical protein